MRLFIAIPLAKDVLDALERLSSGLRADGDGMRWSSREKWHITLQFLGETSDEAYRCVVGRLKDLEASAVPVRLAGTGFFERAGVFFAGVEVTAEMLDLERRVVAATSQCGFAAEDRPYHPHVTLARVKGSRGRHALRTLKSRVKGEAEFPLFIAMEFLLVEAFLGPGGSRYDIRERFPLLAG
jgi:2'-5' RNA ligase